MKPVGRLRSLLVAPAVRPDFIEKLAGRGADAGGHGGRRFHRGRLPGPGDGARYGDDIDRRARERGPEHEIALAGVELVGDHEDDTVRR